VNHSWERELVPGWTTTVEAVQPYTADTVKHTGYCVDPPAIRLDNSMSALNVFIYVFHVVLLVRSGFLGGLAVWGVVPRPLACCDCGFESRWDHVCLSLESVVWCQVEVSASGWSLVQRRRTARGVSECDNETLVMRRLFPVRACCAIKNKSDYLAAEIGSSCLYYEDVVCLLWGTIWILETLLEGMSCFIGLTNIMLQVSTYVYVDLASRQCTCSHDTVCEGVFSY